jgi:hypothetical protein
MKTTCASVAIAAGSVFASGALAQKAAPSTRSELRPVLTVGTRPIVPTEFRRVRLVDNRIEALSEWMAYSPSGGDAGTPTLCFDGYHTVGGNAPGQAPGGGRWTFTWTFTPPGIFDYTSASYATPVNDILPAALPIGAKYFDFVYYENQGPIDEYTSIFTSESYFDSVAPDATWGIFDGWQFHYVAVTTGGWYSNLALTGANIWELPADGAGGVIIRTSRDEAGLIPAQGWQVSQWGTQEHTTPPPVPAKVGTSGPNQWAESSTGGVCASSLATNVADGIWQLSCENFSWTYGPAYPQDPMTICIALGFDAPGGCYADCDGVGGLTANDFICFVTAYNSGASYADCDAVGGLTANDFICFLTAYNSGCS